MKKIYAVRDESDSMYVPVLSKGSELCPYYIVRSPLAIQYGTYKAMQYDLDQCKERIEYFKQVENDDNIPLVVKTSLLIAAIITYAKCFTSSQGASKLDETDLKRVKRGIVDWHTEVMNIRTKYVAHRLNSGFEEYGMVVYLDPDPTNQRLVKDTFACVKMEKDEGNLDRYLELFDAVHTIIENKIQKIIPNWQTELANLQLAQVYHDAEIPDKDKVVEFGDGGI